MKVLIKIGGSLLDDATSRHDLAHQIAALAASGTHVAVVHGGGKQMTRFLEERGVKSTFVRGLRVTTDETIDAVLKVLAGSVNTQLAAALGGAGARAVGLSGIDSGIAIAVQLDPELGFVGRVTSSDPALLETLTRAGYVPVVACIAGGKNGEIYNVNADSMAMAIAKHWQPELVLFLTDVQGVLDATKTTIPLLGKADCQSLIEEGIATGGMQVKLQAALNASWAGSDVRIVRGLEPNIINRVIAGEKLGTRFVTRSDQI